MAEPIAAANQPKAVQLEKGREYHFCRCGRSGDQPFCDGSHEGTGIEPLAFTAREDGEAWSRSVRSGRRLRWGRRGSGFRPGTISRS
jgi:CDGSH-type Zn-finger protein